jgi:uncharacterized cupin superfamily protein
MAEARLERNEYGLVPMTEGWFVVNVRDGAWTTNEARGSAFIVEGGGYDLPQVGYTLAVLQPGQAGRYHREANQEDFLVLQGECIAIVEEQELRLGPWDLLHCAAGVDHVLVGAGEGPCVIFMTGAREGWPEKGVVYPRSELALRHDAGVETETTSSAEAWAGSPPWQPGRPPNWAGLPWDEG